MSEENQETDTQAAEDAGADDAVATAEPETTEASDQSAEPASSVPDFPNLNPSRPKTGGGLELNRFGGVHVVITAELGRTELTLQELMNLSEGSVLELNRSISAPVELVAQGVPLGKGEVVVVEDHFAIRIKEIYQV